MFVYTVGNEEFYDRRLQENRELIKLGRHRDYPGGFAVKSIKDAYRLIKEFGKQNEWAVYELDANWSKDTLQSKNGWWHALINDSLVLRKIESK